MPTSPLPSPARRLADLAPSRKVLNQLAPADRAIHDWYRFVLSFPPHLVRDYLDRFGITSADTVLDPFAGTGTTLVECQKLGIPCVGLEANPMAHFACQTKLNWQPAPAILRDHAQSIAAAAAAELTLMPVDGLGPTLSPAAEKLLLKHSISPRPLQQVLTLLGHIDRRPHPQGYPHERLALAKAAVLASNLRFAPEIGVTNPPKEDAPVLDLWQAAIETMAADLQTCSPVAPAPVYWRDARQLPTVLAPGSVDAVITSPPYPNEKDYTRATRLESVVLGFLQTRQDLRAVKQALVRSNSRSIYSQDTDDQWAAAYPTVLRVAHTVEQRRQDWGKTSGFSRLYGRAIKLYFGGMAKHLAALRPVLRPGAQLAYVVGDQASYLQVHIQTGQLLAEIAQDLGYQVQGIDLFRTRRASKTDVELREEVVLLRWPG
jgi:DNA modification methylase